MLIQEDSTADERDRANLEALNIAERYRDVAIANGVRASSSGGPPQRQQKQQH